MSVRHAILGLLAQQPRHGYDLHGAFIAIVGGSVWPLNPSQIYTTLSRLEEAGLVANVAVRRAGGPDQHIFEITDTGREELTRWYTQGVRSMHARDEVFLKITLALADEQADALSIIRVQRATLYRDLHQLTTHRDKAGTFAQGMLLDKAIMHIEADLRWLDMAEARLHDMSIEAIPIVPERRRGRPRLVPPTNENGGT